MNKESIRQLDDYLGRCTLHFKVDVVINTKFETETKEILRLAIEKTINKNSNHNLVMGDSVLEMVPSNQKLKGEQV